MVTNPLKTLMSFASIMIMMIFLIFFFSDSSLFFMASIDEKLYGEENKYINPDLEGEARDDPSNIKDSYKFQQETTSWQMVAVDFLINFLKFVSVILLPLLLYFLFISDRHGLIQWLDKIFKGDDKK